MLRPLLLVLTAIVCGCSFEGSSSSPATTTSSALGTITRLGGVVSTGTVSPSQTTTFLPLPNGVWVWCADDGPHGVEPYRTDGTVAGTTLLRDLSAGPSPGCRTFVTTNGRALFSGITGVWSSDGTSMTELRLGGQRLQGDLISPTLPTRALIVSSSGSVVATDGVTATALTIDRPIGSFVAMGGNLYFAARASSTLNLWRTDGTQGGSQSLHAYGTGSIPNIDSYLVATATRVFFTVSQSTTVSLFSSTGLAGGLSGPLATLDLVPGTGLMTAGNRVYWLQRSSGAGGPLLFSSDGTAVTQVMEVSLVTGQSFSAVERGGQLVFNGAGLWVTDGTVAGTSRVVMLAGVQSLARAGADVRLDPQHGVLPVRPDGPRHPHCSQPQRGRADLGHRAQQLGHLGLHRDGQHALALLSEPGDAAVHQRGHAAGHR